jgi:hypothetical protein
MPIRNILICTTQVPFTTGGGELHVEHLRRAFVEADYNAEVVALPFKWYPPVEIMRGTFAWRMNRSSDDCRMYSGSPIVHQCLRSEFGSRYVTLKLAGHSSRLLSPLKMRAGVTNSNESVSAICAKPRANSSV